MILSGMLQKHQIKAGPVNIQIGHNQRTSLSKTFYSIDGATCAIHKFQSYTVEWFYMGCAAYCTPK